MAGVISSDPHRKAIAALLDAEHLAPEHVRFHHLMNTVAGSLNHDLPEVTLRGAFAQLAAMFAEGRASYVPAQGDTSLPHLLFG